MTTALFRSAGFGRRSIPYLLFIFQERNHAMFIVAHAQMSFTHENPYTGEKVEDQKADATVRIDLHELQQLIASLIDSAIAGRLSGRIASNGHHDRSAADGNGRQSAG